MKTTVETITPEAAKKILEVHNTDNISMSKSTVDRLARDIAAGLFITTHQGIAFDDSGVLLDGQQRLAACVKANKPIQVLVTRGLPAKHKFNGLTVNTFELLDSGRIRRVPQLLARLGFTSSNNVAAAVKSAVQLCSMRHKLSLTTTQTRQAIHKIGEDRVQLCVDLAIKGKMVRLPSWVAGIAALYHTVNPKAAEEFLTETGDVSGSSGSATRAFAVWINNRRTAGGLRGGGNLISHFPVVAAMLRAHVEGKKVSRAFGSQEAMSWLMKEIAPIATKLAKLAVSFDSDDQPVLASAK